MFRKVIGVVGFYVFVGVLNIFMIFRDVQRCSLLQIRDFWDLTFRGSGVEVV